MTPRLLLALTLTITVLTSCRAEPPSEPPGIPVHIAPATRSDFAPVLTLLGVVRAAQSVPLSVPQHGTIAYPQRFPTGLRRSKQVS